MFNKELIDFDKDKQAYNSKIINAKTKEDKEKCQIELKNTLKLYLYNANKIIKDIFSINPSPYISEEGYNALYKKGATNIISKTKEQYYSELDILKQSSVYLSLDDTKKALINNAILILKLYYEDVLK